MPCWSRFFDSFILVFFNFWHILYFVVFIVILYIFLHTFKMLISHTNTLVTKYVRTVSVLSIWNDLTVLNETLKIFVKICPAPLVMERADGLIWPAQYVCIVCLLCTEFIVTLSCLILSTPIKRFLKSKITLMWIFVKHGVLTG